MKVSELFEGMSKAARAADIEQSDREYIAARKRKEKNIAQLRKDYKNAMAWVNAPQNEVTNHERVKWEERASKMREHGKKQFKIDLNEEVIKVEEEGWYVCDAKERPHHGPMSETKAKALADQFSTNGKKFSAEYFSDYEVSRMNEAGRVFRRGQDVTNEKPKASEPAGDPKKFKKGQKVRVRKTGQEVEVLGFTDAGLVQTVSTNPDDRKIKSWRDHSAAQLKSNLFPAAGHKAYLPRELEV